MRAARRRHAEEFQRLGVGEAGQLGGLEEGAGAVGLPAHVPPLVKKLIKQADRACAFFEATQLAGFDRKESLRLFGAPPADYDLVIHPLPAGQAQARYLERYRLLAGAMGVLPAPDAWHTE